MQFKPFKAIRAEGSLQDIFPVKSIDGISKEDLQNRLKINEISFIRMAAPAIQSEGENLDKAHQNVRENFDKFLNKGFLNKDKPSLYVYRQEKKNGESTHGIIGIMDLDSYGNNYIKKHENTITQREELFAKYLENTHLNAEPVLLTYDPNQRVAVLVDFEMKKSPVTRMRDEDGTEHRLWQISDRLVIKQVKDSIEALPAVYIADGHHRMGSSWKYCQAMREKEEDVSGIEAFNYTMVMMVSMDNLIIKDYNRLVKDLNGLSKKQFLDALETCFTVIPKGKNILFPDRKHQILMYLDGEYYFLYFKEACRGEPEGLGELDTYLFEKHLLHPILNIKDPRTDSRLQYLRGTADVEGVENIKEKVDSGDFMAGFIFFPVAVQDLQKVADLNQTMPPKSTNFEPKLLTGLTIFDLTD